MEKLRLSLVAVWHVQRVLAKKRDPLTHVLFIDECLNDDSPLPSEQIWYADLLSSMLSPGLPVMPGLQPPACILQNVPGAAAAADRRFQDAAWDGNTYTLFVCMPQQAQHCTFQHDPATTHWAWHL